MDVYVAQDEIHENLHYGINVMKFRAHGKFQCSTFWLGGHKTNTKIDVQVAQDEIHENLLYGINIMKFRAHGKFQFSTFWLGGHLGSLR